MVYWIAPGDDHTCERCGAEITLKETCVVGPGHEDNHQPDDEPTMRVTLECSPDCYQFGFPLGPLRDPNGTAIEKRTVPDDWVPDTFVDALKA